MPLTGESSKIVFALASTSRLTGERITITYAADVNCAAAGFRTDLTRISTSEEVPAVR
jgi:hypothetical protein